MSIIYILTIVLIIIMHMLLYKKEEKQNFLLWLIISFCLMLCYNIFTCVILSFIEIKSTLMTLAIINSCIAILLGLKIYKDKKIQKYNINKIDIISLIVILLSVVLLVIKHYGIPLNIKNSITDASTHFHVANEFYNHSILLIKENTDILGIFGNDFLMPGAYINTGILLKIFSSIMNETYFCILFVIFEISMWFLSGLLMYVLLANNKANGKMSILPLIFSLIYMLGYPLNTLISGFSYLQVGLNIIICILIVMKQEIGQYYKSILLFLLNFGLMFSYNYFAPVVFLSVFIQIILDIKKKKEKIFNIKNILNIVISLIIPGLFGVMYFMIFQSVINGNDTLEHYSSIINVPGSIYNNIITNIVIFIIFAVGYIIYNIKNKKQDFSSKIFVVALIFLAILFVGMKCQKISEYYYYKVYYMFWIFVIVNAFNMIILLEEKRKILTNIIVGIYGIGMVIAIALNNNLIVYDIFQKNFEEVFAKYELITHKELEILEYYNKNIDTDNKLDDNTYLYLASSGARARWLNVITENLYILIDATWGEYPSSIQQFLDSDKQYCMIFKKDAEDVFESIKEDNEKFKILLKNEDGAILEKI